jgi:IS5 family transposase
LAPRRAKRKVKTFTGPYRLSRDAKGLSRCRGCSDAVDARRSPVDLLISPGTDHDITIPEALLDGLAQRPLVLADRRYGADTVRSCLRARGATPAIPNRNKRKTKSRWAKALDRQAKPRRAHLQQTEERPTHMLSLQQARRERRRIRLRPACLHPCLLAIPRPHGQVT